MVEWKKLGDVCDVLNGFSFKSQDYTQDGIRVIRISDVQSGYISDKDKVFYPYEKLNEFKKYVLNEGDIVMSLTGNPGRIAVIDSCSIPCALNQRVACLRAKNVIGSYLFYLFNCKEFESIALANSTGGAQKNLSTTWLNNHIIPVPSLSEQSRIVSILDTFTASIDNLKQQIEQRRKQYEHYRDQILDLEGKEGVEMKILLDILQQPITDGPHETPEFFTEGIPFISADAVVNNKIDFNRKRGYISVEYDNQCRKKYSPQLLDIYLVKSGSTTGKVAIVKTEERFNIWSPLAAIRVNKNNNPMFVYYLLQTKQVQEQVRLKSSQGSQPNLSMRVLEKFIIPVPSLEEQSRIFSILDTFEQSIANLEQQLEMRQKQYEFYRNKLLTFK